MLSLRNFTSKFFFTGFLDVQLLVWILRSFVHALISEQHVVILGPVLLGLLEVETRLEARVRLARQVFPPVFGHFTLREFR